MRKQTFYAISKQCERREPSLPLVPVPAVCRRRRRCRHLPAVVHKARHASAPTVLPVPCELQPTCNEVVLVLAALLRPVLCMPYLHAMWAVTLAHNQVSHCAAQVHIFAHALLTQIPLFLSSH